MENISSIRVTNPTLGVMPFILTAFSKIPSPKVLFYTFGAELEVCGDTHSNPSFSYRQVAKKKKKNMLDSFPSLW